MRVVHIAFSDYGGAGIAVYRIHNALLAQGIESRMLVAEKKSFDETVIVADVSPDLVYTPPRNRVLRRVMGMMRKRGYFLSPKEKYDRKVSLVPSNHRTFFTSPLSCYDLVRHPLVRKADLIHLHWIANFIDYPSFFPNVDKPVVWTLHDENLAYGGFHYGREKEMFYPYYTEVEEAYRRIKRSSLKQCESIHVVALSRMMKDFYATQSFLSDRDISIIYNGIDTDTFRVFDKSIGRQIYHIPEDRLVIVFCSWYLNDSRKGLNELVRAMEQFGRTNVMLLCIGNGRFEGKTPIEIRYTGPISNDDLLAMTYSCGDIFAFPSFQEAFAQAPLEAISCGLPVVAFPCSGMKELISDRNGIVCEDFSVEALRRGLDRIVGGKYDRQSLHKDITSRFDIEKIASDYGLLYSSLVRS